MVNDKRSLMNKPATFDDLVVEAENLKLYEKLIAQLNKDLQLANIDLLLDEEILPTSLKLVLHEAIFDLIQNKFADYLNLLYIIDVSEKRIRQLDGSDAVKLSEQVAFLILLREWQKVWYRTFY